MGEEQKPEAPKEANVVKQPAPADTRKYWLVIVADSVDKPPACIECSDKDAFEKALNDQVLSAKEDLHAFAFRGDRIQIGTPQPVGVYIIDGEAVQVGKTAISTDNSGKIVPLVPRSDT